MPAANAPDPVLLGILTLLAAERVERDPKASPPTEVLLVRAGLSYDLIASILDKKPDSVRKAANRAEKPTSKGKK
jgi:DNA-directed RNA polymerase specialized sigma24 family protein